MKRIAKWVTLLKAFIYRAGRTSIFQCSKRRFITVCAAMLGGLLLASLSQAVIVKAGDILVADRGANKLILVDRYTGVRSVLSDFSDPAQGPVNGTIPYLTGIAVGRYHIYAADMRTGIFRIDPHTGHRTLVSSFHDGNDGFAGNGLAADPRGRIIASVIPNASFQPPHSFVVRVSPHTGNRVVITDFTNQAQGPYVSDFFITDLALEHRGTILVSMASFELRDVGQAAIYRVDPLTGHRTIFSDFGNAAQGTVLGDLHFTAGISVEHDGTVLLNSSGDGVRNLLFKINPLSGNREILSDFDDPIEGPIGTDLYGAAVEDSGHALVGARVPGFSSYNLFRVNTHTGHRALFSASADPRQGLPLNVIAYIAVVPEDARFCISPAAGSLNSPFDDSK